MKSYGKMRALLGIMQRKLTAILSADVVGYSGLMETDEAGTLERLKVNRSTIFDPQVATHGGRVFKLMGDGALVEFSSVIAAVNCALAIQDATEKAGTEIAEAKRIRYRIGINLGEVIVEGDDIYGEGRQRGCAAPGPRSGGRRSPLPRRPGSSRRQGPLRV